MRTNMKNEFKNTTYTQKGFIVESSILQKTGLMENRIRLIGTDGLVILQKGDMTARDMITTIEGLVHFADKMLTELADKCEEYCCGDCDECHNEEDEDIDNFFIKTDDDNGILITPSECDFALSDIPEQVFDLFEEYGICLRALNKLLKSNEIIE